MRRSRQAGVGSLAIGAALFCLATEAESERFWSEFIAAYPGYATYRERARPRVIPIVMLDPRA